MSQFIFPQLFFPNHAYSFYLSLRFLFLILLFVKRFAYQYLLPTAHLLYIMSLQQPKELHIVFRETNQDSLKVNAFMFFHKIQKLFKPYSFVCYK